MIHQNILRIIYRIGRTGKAEEKGKSILFFTEREEKYKGYIENLMQYEIPELEIPDCVEITQQLTEETQSKWEKFLQKY